MLGDYSEFENICKVLVCNELVKRLFGICLIVFQRVAHSSCVRNLTKLPSRYLGGSFRLYMLRKCDYFVAGLIHPGLISSL